MKPRKTPFFGAMVLFGTASTLLTAAPDGKIHLSYWEKWSGIEQVAMQAVVEQFNRSQDRITVDFLSVGQIEQKTLLAIAGGDPPDLAGVYLGDICAFADRKALVALDPFIQEDGSTPDEFLSRYAAAYADKGSYRGETWGVPTTPTTVALYWNKDAFRAAGLDPEKPPRTLAELDSMSDKLTKYDAAGNLTQVGFLPQQSGGWAWGFPQWFGGQIFDGRRVTIAENPANLRAFEWIDQFSQKYGIETVRHLASSFGGLESPQDPFMSGQVTIMLDGVWRHNYIEKFAPGLDYGVAGWPEVVPGIDDFSIADEDLLVIPRGAKHPREAWEFMKFVSSPNLAAQSENELSGVELLCFLQKKGSPLQQWSPFFESHHPNPDIKVFRQLAESPHTIAPPQMGTWDDYHGDLNLAFDKVRLGLETPAKALQECQARSEASWDWHQKSLALRQPHVVSASANPPPVSPPR